LSLGTDRVQRLRRPDEGRRLLRSDVTSLVVPWVTTEHPLNRIHHIPGRQVAHTPVMTLGARRLLAGAARHGAVEVQGPGMVRPGPGDVRRAEESDDR